LDYLIIGHITEDLLDGGFTHGGSASYSSLTAHAFGLDVGIVTAGATDTDFLSSREKMHVVQTHSPVTTTFKNLETPTGRKQYLLKAAPVLAAQDVPPGWRSSRIVHFGPVAQEIDPGLIDCFPRETFIGMTPQGCMRSWDEQGLVTYCDWQPSQEFLGRLDAVVISIEDVQGNEDIISGLARQLDVLVVTEGYNGARVYWHGDVRRFDAPSVDVVDPTGAGDIFAAVFFIRMLAARDPWQATRLAVSLASLSVSRKGLESIPTAAEINSASVEILKGAS